MFFPGIMALQAKNVIYRTNVLFMSMFSVLFNVLNLCPVRRFAIFKKVIDYRFQNSRVLFFMQCGDLKFTKLFNGN